MTDDLGPEANGRFSRRRLVAGAFAAAAVVPLAASCSTDSPPAVPDSPTLSDAPNARNVKSFGAKGDGTTDDTEAFRRACSQVDDRLVLYIPAGTYRLSSVPELPSFSTVIGDGSDLSVMLYPGSETLVKINGKQRIAFKRVGIYVTDPSATALTISASFRCSFDSVVIRGNHSGENYPQYERQRGVVLDQNSGGTAFINSDINNFGIGLTSRCIQNYVTSSKFTSNRIGVLGAGNDKNAGLALANVEFVSDRNEQTTDTHLKIEGAANDWWLTNCWFEGCNTAITVGGPTGGPSQFGLVNAKLAARDTCIDLRSCRQPFLANVALDRDSDAPVTEIRIDTTNCPEGTAMNLISSSEFDLPGDVFPPNWTVIGRGTQSGATFQSQVVMRKANSAEDILQVQGDNFAVSARVAPSGTWVSEDVDAGIVLRGENGRYFRLGVDAQGAVRATDLGVERPN